MANRSPISDRPLPSSFDSEEALYNERFLNKVARKVRKEPLIPIGCAVTVWAFVNAYRSMRKGDSKSVQRWFRARVAAQAFTVVAIVGGGMYYAEDRHRSRELWKEKALQDAEEKHKRWIRELEIRDEEERALQLEMEKRRQRSAAQGRQGRGQRQGQQGPGTKAGGAAAAASSSQDVAGGDKGTHKTSSMLDTLMLGGWFGASKKAAPEPSAPTATTPTATNITLPPAASKPDDSKPSKIAETKK